LAKAQAMFEFMLVVTVMMVILIFAISLREQRQTQANEIDSDGAAKQLCNSFSSGVEQVFAAGQGSGMNLSIPNKLGKSIYNATVSSDNLLILSYDQKNFFCPFSVKVSNGTSNTFQIFGPTLTLSNDGEVVIVT
jgi:hypothetical protein